MLGRTWRIRFDGRLRWESTAGGRWGRGTKFQRLDSCATSNRSGTIPPPPRPLLRNSSIRISASLRGVFRRFTFDQDVAQGEGFLILTRVARDHLAFLLPVVAADGQFNAPIPWVQANDLGSY